MPDDKADLIYGSVLEYACACGKHFKHEINLREHIAQEATSEHRDERYRRARTKAEWAREQRDFFSLQLRIGKPPRRRNP